MAEGQIAVNITANTAQFQKAITSAGKEVALFGGVVGGVASAVTSAFINAVQAGVSTIAGFVNEQREAIDTTTKVADRLGATTEELFQLQYSAELANVSNDQLNSSLQFMVKNLAAAEDAGSEQAKTLKRMGLDWQTLVTQSPAKSFREIGEAIAGMETPYEQVSVAQDLLGKSGIDMLNVLTMSQEEFALNTAECDAFGLSLSRIDTAQVESMNDSVTKVQKSLAGLANQILLKIAPYVEYVANMFTTWMKNTVSGNDVVSKSFTFVKEAVAGVATGLQFLYGFWNGLKAIYESVLSVQLKVIRAFVEFISYIPGADELLPLQDIQVFLNDMIRETDKAAIEAGNAFVDMRDVILGNAPTWGEAVIEEFDGIEKASREMAKEVADTVAETQRVQRNARPEQFTKKKKEKEDKVGQFAQFDRSLINIQALGQSNTQKVTDEDNLKEAKKQTTFLQTIAAKTGGAAVAVLQ